MFLKMNRLFLLGLGFLIVLGGCKPELDKVEQPNIVLFLVDDLGWTDLSSYGSNLYQTPNVDNLAAEGVSFTNAYSACTVCSPTRAAIMTGKYPARINLTDYIGGSRKGKLLPAVYERQVSLEEITLA